MTGSKNAIASDLAKVDAYENTAADYEEIPEITDKEFARSFRHKNGVFVEGKSPTEQRPKQSVTLRLDTEIVDYFRALGPDWHREINDVLSETITVRSGRRVPKTTSVS